MSWVIITDIALKYKLAKYLENSGDPQTLPDWIDRNTLDRRDTIYFCEITSYEPCADRVARPASDKEIETLQKRKRSYSQNIVDNLRQNDPQLTAYSDDQLYNTWSDWTISDDFDKPETFPDWVIKRHGSIIFKEEYTKLDEPLPEPKQEWQKPFFFINHLVKRSYEIEATIMSQGDKEILLDELNKITDLFNELETAAIIIIKEYHSHTTFTGKYKDSHKNKYKIICINDTEYSQNTIRATLRTVCGLTALKKAIEDYVNC